MNKVQVRLAVMGIGNELRGDDAAGIMVARMLRSSASASFLVVDGGAAPENFTGTLRDFAPNFVLLVDAIQMDELPGTIRLFNTDDLESTSLTTHTLSCHLFALYLETELKCAVKVLGIQAGQDAFGEGLSPAVRQSTHTIVKGLRQMVAW